MNSDIDNSFRKIINICNKLASELRGGCWIINDQIIPVIGSDIHEEVGFNFAFDYNGFKKDIISLAEKVKQSSKLLDLTNRKISNLLIKLTSYSGQSEEFLYVIKDVISYIKKNNQQVFDELRNIISEHSINDIVSEVFYHDPINITQALIDSGFVKVRKSSKELFIESKKLDRTTQDAIVKYLLTENVKDIRDIVLMINHGQPTVLSVEDFLKGPQQSGFFRKPVKDAV